MSTVEMHVRHGDYNEKESATADTIEAALLQILETPLGIGYGIQPGSRYYLSFMEVLKASGRAKHGWAEYAAKEAV